MQAISRSDTPSVPVVPSDGDEASAEDRLSFESRRRKSGPEFPGPAGPPMASARESGLVERTLMDAANVINSVGATELPLLAPAR